MSTQNPYGNPQHTQNAQRPSPAPVAQAAATATEYEKTYSGYRKRLLLGGWFGWHHYYTNNTSKGILYSCTFGGFFVGWVKDMLSNPRRTFNREMASQGIHSTLGRR